ncbi:MAG: secretin N-terminal domain-containing protein [Candidatus Omnitrophica bacterium]|nr:secretin N-terminal domain-containing protein [Candidatus Omnitrophota bacterium]
MNDRKIFRAILCAAVISAQTMLPAAGSAAGTAEPAAKPDPAVQMAQAPAVLPIVVDNASGLGMQGAISLDLRNIDIVDALKFLSTKAGINVITTKNVSGRVTLLVDKATIQDVFDLMLRSNNLAYDMKGDIYNVMSQEEYRALYGKSFSDVRQVKVFYLKYTIPEQAFGLVDMLKSEVGRVLVDPESGNMMVMDAPDRLAMIGEVLKDFEEKNTVKVIKLNYAKAKDVEEALKNQLDTKKVGLIKADERGNQILVQTLPERMEQIESLIKDLDQKTKEIIIDVSIVQVKLSDLTTQGVQWEGLFNIMSDDKKLTYLGAYPFSSVQAANDAWRSRQSTWEAVRNVGSYPFTGTTTSYSSGRRSIGTSEMHLGIVGNQDFDIIIQYLQTLGSTKIMSNPKIAVTNNQEAKIHVGQKEAYVTTTTTTGQTTNTVSEQVNFVDVGVMLSVVPTINEEGFINLKVKAEVNSVVDTLITPTENQIPIIDTSLAETTVLVKEGSTVVIGGLRKDTKIDVVKQTPYLGQIPILGNLFKYKSKEIERSELLLVLTPKIISGEVFVSTAEGKPVGESGLKPVKGYGRLQGEPRETKIQEKVYLPFVREEKLELRPLRKH